MVMPRMYGVFCSVMRRSDIRNILNCVRKFSHLLPERMVFGLKPGNHVRMLHRDELQFFKKIFKIYKLCFQPGKPFLCRIHTLSIA